MVKLGTEADGEGKAESDTGEERDTHREGKIKKGTKTKKEK